MSNKLIFLIHAYCEHVYIYTRSDDEVMLLRRGALTRLVCIIVCLYLIVF
jgi:hypothetical protein